ncbi:4-hydroxy-tetrahydrodipicolinate reductase [Kytococcus sedentarius]|uniref:4-hydroxy-tetrahydrodipicolinate reductase n=1 Tax=Kytococcus sedentarius TaxID=1276 RepID=UPI0035BBB3BA
MDSTPHPLQATAHGPAIGLVGHGRMGQAVHRLAADAGCRVTCIVAPTAAAATHRSLDEVTPAQAPDVWIDFSHPSAIWSHLEAYSRGTVPAVIGTTGWTDRLDEAHDLFASASAPAVWAGNFSVGVTLLLRLVEHATALLEGVGGYDVGIHEVHHRRKADSPSGTALHLAEALGRADDLQISSTRIGHVPGTHTVWFDSPQDTLELTHTARSRDGFAAGALRAARWLTQEPPAPGLWRFDDLLAERLATTHPGEGHRIGTPTPHPTQEDA